MFARTTRVPLTLSILLLCGALGCKVNSHAFTVVHLPTCVGAVTATIAQDSGAGRRTFSDGTSVDRGTATIEGLGTKLQDAGLDLTREVEVSFSFKAVTGECVEKYKDRSFSGKARVVADGDTVLDFLEFDK